MQTLDSCAEIHYIREDFADALLIYTSSPRSFVSHRRPSYSLSPFGGEGRGEGGIPQQSK